MKGDRQMILKVQGLNDGEWVLIDNIREFTMTEKDVPTAEVKEIANWDLTHPNWPQSSNGSFCKTAYIKIQDKSEAVYMIFDGRGFLCNDNGQTIEKL